MPDKQWSLAHPPARTAASDECHAALGRALEVAGGFAAWCLAHSSAAGGQHWPKPGDQSVLLGDAAIVRVVELLRTRPSVAPSRPGTDLLAEDVASVVERGQSCYREVLYGIAPGIQVRLGTAADRRKFLDELAELAHGIAHATSVVATLAFMTEEQPIPPDAESEAYVRAVVGWVCDPLDGVGTKRHGRA